MNGVLILRGALDLVKKLSMFIKIQIIKVFKCFHTQFQVTIPSFLLQGYLELKTPCSKFLKLMLEIKNPLLGIKLPTKGFESVGL
jgi:hypothetical protein